MKLKNTVREFAVITFAIADCIGSRLFFYGSQ